MNHVIARVRGFALIAFFVCYILLIGTSSIARLAFSNAIRRRTDAMKRKIATAWIIRHGDRLIGAAMVILGFKIRYLGNRPLASETGAGAPPPAIYIANHVGSVDIPVLTHLGRLYGVEDARWVMKRAVLKMYVIGWICRMAGCAPVGRSGTKDAAGKNADIETIKRAASWAREEGGSVVIFPEGTTKSSGGRDGYRRALPPKHGGVSVFREMLPDYPVVRIAMRWTTDEDIQTIWQLHRLVGQRLDVFVDLLPEDLVRERPVAEWLPEAWREMDQKLVSESC